jgi:hypothetical protein
MTKQVQLKQGCGKERFEPKRPAKLALRINRRKEKLDSLP